METYRYIYENINLENCKSYIGQHKSKFWDSIVEKKITMKKHEKNVGNKKNILAK
jgi:hypothetical protein